VPVALGLIIGGVIAFQAGSSNLGLYQVVLGTPVADVHLFIGRVPEHSIPTDHLSSDQARLADFHFTLSGRRVREPAFIFPLSQQIVLGRIGVLAPGENP
jgi:hypothetical protein